MKTYGNEKGQYSYFAVRLYCENADRLKHLIETELEARHYAFILHDKDTYKDDNENHKKGDIKKAHYHIVINLKTKTSWNVLKNRILKVLPESNPRIRDIYDTESATLYLTHETKQAQKDGKYQYNRNDITTDDYSYWQDEETQRENKKEKVDYISTFVEKFISNGNVIRREDMETFRKEYGRDFILNFNRVMQYLEIYTGRKQSTLFTDTDLFIQATTANIMYKLETTWGLSTIITRGDDNEKRLKETDEFIQNELREYIR